MQPIKKKYFSALFAVLLLLGLLCPVVAQQLPYHTQFRQFQQIINPASVNNDLFLYEYNLSFLSSYRMQWIDHPETPRTYQLSGEFVSNFGNNFELVTGASLLQDRTGPIGLTGLHGRVGSLFSRNPYFGGLSVGFSFGMVEYRVTADRIAWEDPTDPNIPLNNISFSRPEVGLGIFYYKRLENKYFKEDNVYFGLSANRLLPDNSLLPVDDREIEFQQVPHYYGTAGWYHFFNEDFFLETSLWAKYTAGLPVNIDFNARLQPIRTFWVGTGFNLNGLVHLESGVNIPGLLFDDANLKIGYGFNYNIGAFGLNIGTSHELNLAVAFDSYR